MSFRQANGEIQRDAGDIPDLIVSLITNSITLTTHPAGEQFVLNSSLYAYKLDLLGMRQIRLTARVTTASASVNNPRIQLRYNTSFNTSSASYSAIGASGQLELSLAATGLIDSGWIPLVSGAKINDCHLGLIAIGGDGALSPAVGSIMAHFR